MKVDKCLRRLRDRNFAAEERQRFADAVGDEFGRRRPEVIRELLTGMARLRSEVSRDDVTAAAYLAAIADVTSGYLAVLERDVAEEKLAALAKEKDWLPVMAALREKPRTSVELQEQIGLLTLDEVLVDLAAMAASGLIEAGGVIESGGASPPAAVQRFGLTLLGERLLDRLGQGRLLGERLLDRLGRD